MIISRNDVQGIILAFTYILVFFAITDRVWKGGRAAGRKVLHFSMGNIVVILYIFDSIWAAVPRFLAMGATT